jgi:hypothetical protein
MHARLSGWNMAYLGLMLVGLVMAAYHASSDRWGNAIIAAGAALLGGAVILTDRSPERQVRPAAEPRHSRSEELRTRWHASDSHGTIRERWLTGSILAGFAATLVMAITLVMAYAITGFLGSENGNQFSQWLWALSHNNLTEGVWDIPMAALAINLLAGLAWALVYGAFIEPRLSGPGWWRGMVFSLIPWLLSLVVFLPAVGAGFFGMDLDAGPLPAIGNLLLHLIYGVTLGTVYAIDDVSEAEGTADQRSSKLQNDGTAFGLVIGLTAGLVIGAIASAIFAPDVHDGINLTLGAGGVGTLVGGLIGPFAGLQSGNRHHETA